MCRFSLLRTPLIIIKFKKKDCCDAFWNLKKKKKKSEDREEREVVGGGEIDYCYRQPLINVRFGAHLKRLAPGIYRINGSRFQNPRLIFT